MTVLLVTTKFLPSKTASLILTHRVTDPYNSDELGHKVISTQWHQHLWVLGTQTTNYNEAPLAQYVVTLLAQGQGQTSIDK